jgi:hypothetical protein
LIPNQQNRLQSGIRPVVGSRNTDALDIMRSATRSQSILKASKAMVVIGFNAPRTDPLIMKQD